MCRGLKTFRVFVEAHIHGVMVCQYMASQPPTINGVCSVVHVKVKSTMLPHKKKTLDVLSDAVQSAPIN